MSAASPSRTVRTPDVVWRVTDRSVLVRCVDSTAPTPSARLVAGAALVWIAADVPATLASLAADTGLAMASVAEAVDELTASGWLVEAS